MGRTGPGTRSVAVCRPGRAALGRSRVLLLPLLGMSDSLLTTASHRRILRPLVSVLVVCLLCLPLWGTLLGRLAPLGRLLVAALRLLLTARSLLAGSALSSVLTLLALLVLWSGLALLSLLTLSMPALGLSMALMAVRLLVTLLVPSARSRCAAPL